MLRSTISADKLCQDIAKILMDPNLAPEHRTAWQARFEAAMSHASVMIELPDGSYAIPFHPYRVQAPNATRS